MFDFKKNFNIAANEKKNLESNITLGIYNWLYSKNLLAYEQLFLLTEKENIKKSVKRGTDE